MITWMQKHKKYLVVTIWISTIAFVGAGFVGWGAYDFNSDRASAIAKVGDKKITVKDFQLAYGNLYSYYSQLSNGQLTQEQAKEMGLERVVINNLINETLLLNYANDLGLTTLDEDVKQELIKDENFQKDGIFDKEQYYLVLKNIGMNPKEYEISLKKQILLSKLDKIIELPANDKEIEMLASSLFIKDKVEISVLNASSDELNITEEELKETWEKSKNIYLTKINYKLGTIFVEAKPTDANESELTEFYNENKLDYKEEDGKIKTYEAALDEVKKDYSLKKTKREALETHLKVKKGELNSLVPMDVQEDDANFPVNELKDAKKGDTLKPFEYKNGFLVVKVEDIIMPKPMEFEQAKSQVRVSLEKTKTHALLEQKAKDKLANFTDGVDIGFVSRDDIKTEQGLSENEFGVFLSQLFDNNDKQGYVILENKAVIYKILEQKLLDNSKLDEYKKLLTDNVKQLKNGEIRQNLLEELRKKYSIEQYYKGSWFWV